MKKHLIVVYVQQDFCPGGSLGVERGNDIIDKINTLIFGTHFDTIVGTQDWHPWDHCSFKENGGVWPGHCIFNTPGACLHPDLYEENFNLIFRKGMKQDVDSYSAFMDDNHALTGLHRFYVPDIDDDDIGNDFYIVGIATDFCVKATALDCKELFGSSYDRVNVVIDACAPVSEEGEADAIKQFEQNDIQIVNTLEVVHK